MLYWLCAQEAGLEAQVRGLKAFGCDEIYQEQVSSVGERLQLDAAIKSLRSGDKLVVTKLDRLARSVRHLGDMLETLEAKGTGLVVLSMGGQQVDTTTATWTMMLNFMASVAQFKIEVMLSLGRCFDVSSAHVGPSRSWQRDVASIGLPQAIQRKKYFDTVQMAKVWVTLKK